MFFLINGVLLLRCLVLMLEKVEGGVCGGYVLTYVGAVGADSIGNG